MSSRQRLGRRAVHRGITLVDLVATITALVLVMALAGTFSSRAKELSRRRLCSLNLKSIGTTCRIYANDYAGSWPVPPFKQRLHQFDYIRYTNTDGSVGLPNTQNGEIGWRRSQPSTSRTEEDIAGGSSAVSVTRSFWILVRSGEIPVDRFYCPSSGGAPDPTTNTDLYYDFTEYANISYGYQVPFGPRDTQPREGADNRMVLSADKGPFYVPAAGIVQWDTRDGGPIEVDDTPAEWRRFNSPNHGGRGMGDGQNCLFADGHVNFERRPTAGIDGDNIYTAMENRWTDFPYNVIHGATVHLSVIPDPFPGQQALGHKHTEYSSTDSLIYP